MMVCLIPKRGMKGMFNTMKKKLVAGAMLSAMLATSITASAPSYAAPDDDVNTAVVQQLMKYPINYSKILDTNAPYKIYMVDESGQAKEMTSQMQYPVKEMNNRSALAVRDFEKLLGTEITWNGKYKIAIAKQSNINTAQVNTVYFPINRKAYAVNDNVKSMDTSAAVHARYNRTYIPLRYLSEALGLEVQFISKDNCIWIGTDPAKVREKAWEHANSNPTPKPNPNQGGGDGGSVLPKGNYKEIAAQHFQLITPNQYTAANASRKMGRFVEWNTDFNPENLSFLWNQVVCDSGSYTKPYLSPDNVKSSTMWRNIQNQGGVKTLTIKQKQYVNDRMEYTSKYPGSVYNISFTDQFTGDRFMLDQYGILMNVDRPGRDVPSYNAVYPTGNPVVYESVFKEGTKVNNRKQAGAQVSRNSDINKIFTEFYNKNSQASRPIDENVLKNLNTMTVHKVSPFTKFSLAGFDDGFLKGGNTNLEHIFIPVINGAGQFSTTSSEQYSSYDSRLGYRTNLSGEIRSNTIKIGIVFEDGYVRTNLDTLILDELTPQHGRIRSMVFFKDDANYLVDTAYYVNYQEYWTGNKTIRDISGGLES